MPRRAWILRSPAAPRGWPGSLLESSSGQLPASAEAESGERLEVSRGILNHFLERVVGQWRSTSVHFPKNAVAPTIQRTGPCTVGSLSCRIARLTFHSQDSTLVERLGGLAKLHGHRRHHVFVREVAGHPEIFVIPSWHRRDKTY